MSQKDRANRRRWAIDQQERARAARVAPSQSDRVAELRAFAKTLEQFPHMADTLASVTAEIARLEAAPC